MNKLNPDLLFARLIQDLPPDLHGDLFVVGSLAAAYHYRVKLAGRGVNTKDADLIVRPAGNAKSCREMATRLLELGWRRKEGACFPQAAREPAADLRAIRLTPPESQLYFVEFLNLPEPGQKELKVWLPVEFSDGWYGLPTFKFQGLTALDRQRSEHGLEYAIPSMMALGNLLSHPVLGGATMSEPIGGRGKLLRSAKDLGRVLALAHLEGREGTEAWLGPWRRGLKACFPGEWQHFARQAGSGLAELITSRTALEQAWHTCEYGLLNGQGVGPENLRAVGRRLLGDVIEPLAEAV